MAQEADAELEIVDRHALVCRVNQARGDLDVHRARREEAVGDRSECLAEPVAVRETGDADWHGHRARLRLAHPGIDRLPERRLDRRAGSAVRLEHLELVVPLAEYVAD